MFRLSFLTTLNICKDYLSVVKGYAQLHECEAKFCSCELWPEIEFVLVHLSLKETIVFVPPANNVETQNNDVKNELASENVDKGKFIDRKSVV